MIEALRASPCLSSNCAVAPCRAPPPHLFAASIAPHTARRLNRTEASHQPSLGRALALHPRSISLPLRFSTATVRALAHSPVRSSVHPSARPSARLPILSLSLPFPLLCFACPFPRAPSRFLFPPARTTNPTFARLLGRAPSSFALFLPAPSRLPSRTMCAVYDALRSCIFLYVVRSALCARPCPARPMRARAHTLHRLVYRGVRWMTPCT